MSPTARRERPPLSEGGGIVWRAVIHAFFCEGCEEYIEIRKRCEYDDAEFVLRMKEMLIADHTECWEFSDPEMARQARKFRKRKKLEQNLAARGGRAVRAAGTLAVALLACGVCAAQGPSLAGVRARCALLQGYVKAATGLELAVAAQALDDCRAEAARLTPRRESKWGMLAGYLGPTLAVGQVTYAASRNMGWLETRKRQKNAGAVEFNFAGEVAVGSYLVEGMAARWWRDHKRHKQGKAAEDLQQAVTDAVLLPR